MRSPTPPCNAESENAGNHISTTPIRLNGVVIDHIDVFIPFHEVCPANRTLKDHVGLTEESERSKTRC
jgi:hypothetical protein